MPAVLADGVMAPVDVFNDKPAGLAENVPPVVPVMVGLTGVVTDLQNGEAYAIVAVGALLMVIVNVAKPVHTDEITERVMVYVPAVLAAALMAPVDELIESPAGELVNVPPGAPVIVGFIAPVKFLQ